MTPKLWKPGVADETWKVLICARDFMRADDIMGHLVYVLTTAGADTEAGLEQISKMTGKQIVDGLKAYALSSSDSIKRGMGKP